MDGRDYFEVRRKGADAIAHVRAGAGPVPRPRDGHAAVLALALRRPEEVPRCRTSSQDEAEHDPIVVLDQAARRRGRARPPSRPTQIHDEAKETVRAAAEPRSPRPVPTRASATVTSSGRCRWSTIRASPRSRPTPRSSRSAKRSGSRCTSRWRATNASACSARTSPTPTPNVIDEVPGQGRRVRHHVRAAARVRRRPLLQHAARGGEHHRARGRPGDARPAARAPRSSSSTTCGPR